MKIKCENCFETFKIESDEELKTLSNPDPISYGTYRLGDNHEYGDGQIDIHVTCPHCYTVHTASVCANDFDEDK